MKEKNESYCDQIRSTIIDNPRMDYGLALFLMVREGNLEMVEFIVGQTKCTKPTLELATEVAAIYDHVEILKFLVLNGADVTICFDKLNIIANCAAWEVLTYLLENGADIKNLSEEAREVFYRWKRSLN